jgi:hypothetical protein
MSLLSHFCPKKRMDSAWLIAVFECFSAVQTAKTASGLSIDCPVPDVITKLRTAELDFLHELIRTALRHAHRVAQRDAR